MAWRDQLQPSSFRGVEFLEETDEETGGRRVALHEFPFRDTAFPEDMGAVDGVFNITGFVIGADYIQQKDALLEALNKQGPGTLARRHSGHIKVQMGDVRVIQTNRKGGMATFTMTFYSAGKEVLPTVSSNTQKIVATKSDAAVEVIQKQFVKSFKTQSLPAWVSEQAQSLVSDLESKLSPLGILNASINEYINLPSNLAGKVISLIASLSSVTQFSTLFSFGDDLLTVPTTTPSRRQQASNQEAIISLVRSTALIESARQASSDSYDSAQQAIVTRNELADALDEQMQTADDESYIALQDVRVAHINDMTTRAANLKQISSYTPQATLPAVALAHRLYGDALKDSEIIVRNNVKHPGFVSGGEPLEVLNV